MILATRRWGSPSGRVALLVHGGADASTTWTRVGPWLAMRGWDVIAVDLRGHGDSAVDPIASDRSFRTMANDLVQTCAALHPAVRSVDLMVGHSLGATVALHCAVANPAFVRRLVLEDGPPGPSLDWRAAGDWVFKAIVSARRSPDALVRELRESEPAEDVASLEAFAAAIGSADPAYVPDMVRRLGLENIFELAERCQPRTLLLVGRDAHGTPGGSALVGEDRSRFASNLPSSTLVELDSGHRLHSQVFDGFVGAVDEWLGGSASAEPST